MVFKYVFCTGVSKKSKGRKRGRRVKKGLKPWTVASQLFTRPKPRRRHRRRGPKRSRSMTRGGARRRCKRRDYKKMKQKRNHYKKKTLRKFYSVMRKLSDSLPDFSSRGKKIL
jgi:hypothetical protein